MSRTKHPRHVRKTVNGRSWDWRRWHRRNVYRAPERVGEEIAAELLDLELAATGFDRWCDAFKRQGGGRANFGGRDWDPYSYHPFNEPGYRSDRCDRCGCYEGCDCDSYYYDEDDYDHWRDDRWETCSVGWRDAWVAGVVDTPLEVDEMEYNARMAEWSTELYYASSEHVGCTCDECCGVYFDGCDNWPGEEEFFGWPADTQPVADLTVLVAARMAEKELAGERRRAYRR